MRLLFALPLILVATPALARNVDVEVIEQQKDKSTQTVKFTLSIGDVACAEIQVRVGAKPPPYKVKVCPMKSDIELEVQGAETYLRALTAAKAAQRTVMGRVEKPDGSAVEVAMTPR